MATVRTSTIYISCFGIASTVSKTVAIFSKRSDDPAQALAEALERSDYEPQMKTDIGTEYISGCVSCSLGTSLVDSSLDSVC
jgi:hypothetical protein